MDVTNADFLVDPSMFAWHGSPLGNWHGIIREGLHFKETLHGRAYGNGCYHSLHLETSKGYAHSPGFAHTTATSAPMMWQHSQLAISSAISLNEIVNVPAEFVSRVRIAPQVYKICWLN